MGGEFRFRLGIRENRWSLLPSTLAQVSGAIVAGCVCTGPSRRARVKKFCDFYENFTKNRLKMGVLQRRGWAGSPKKGNC